MSSGQSEPTARDLPKDVVFDILTRLPVRSLVRFKSVSKSWYALLANPTFTTKHFNHQITSQPTSTDNTYCLLFTRRQTPTNRSVTLLSKSKPLDVPINLDIPFLRMSKPLRISGTCNGLVCLSVTPLASIILLWNPATREFKDLPISPVDRPHAALVKVVLGFGFDVNSNDYKVLRIVYCCYPDNQVEIYSLRTDSWREISTSVGFIIFEPSSRVVVRGRFHWTALGVGDLNGRELIVSFDMGDEVFRHMTLPDFSRAEDDSSDEDDGGFHWLLIDWKESIGMIVYPGGDQNSSFDLWVMREYGVAGSWTKHMSFGPYPRVKKPLGCGKSGEVLLQKDNGELVLYYPNTHELEDVPVNGSPYCSEVFIHMESLLPIKGGKVVEEVNLSPVGPDLFFVRKIDLTL